MRSRRFGANARYAFLFVLAALSFIVAPQAMAQTSKSPNYQVTESQFGAGGSAESCSSTYCARVSIGSDAGASSATSPALGTATYSEPMIEMSVEPGASSLGDLSTERTGIKVMKVNIRNYLSGGYMLQIVGSPPKYKDHTLRALSTVGEPLPGTEQFGINAVANTIPQTIGANPVAQPAGTDDTSLILPGFNTPNVFKYVDGATIAASQATTGGADFTITMMVNIASSTPAGLYSGDFAAVVLPYY